MIGRTFRGRVVQSVYRYSSRRQICKLRRHFGAAVGAADSNDEAPSSSPQRVAVIGAGQIGTAVSQGLLRGGHQVFVYDPSDANAAALKAAGAVWMDSAERAVHPDNDDQGPVDVLITAVPAPPHVRSVMEGEGTDSPGLLSSLPEGTTWIDHTTTHPEEARRLGAIASELGIRVLEAPLTGGYALLVAGMMTVLVGGDKALLDAHRDLLKTYSATVHHVGEIGHASVVKLITNQLAATHLVAAGEAVMMAKQSGVELNAFFDSVRSSAGNSYVFETEVPLMFNQTFDPGFFISLHNKDLGIARDVHTGNRTNIAANQYDDVYAVNATAERVYRETEQRYGPLVGSSHPAKLIQEKGGESLACDGFEDWTYQIEKVKSGSIGVVHKNVGRDDC